jgi:ParB-like chromosome segregation protein Spo0J
MPKQVKQIEMWEVPNIKPNPINENIYLTADVTDLTKSMDRLKEMLEPIIITAEGVILSGHRRYKAAIALGWKTVPVRIVEVPEDHQLIYLIAANSYREKKYVEKVSEIRVINAYAETYGRDTLKHFISKDTSELTLRQQIAEVVGLCEVYVSRLQKIADEHPEYIPMMDAGELTLNKAYQSCIKGKSPVPQPKAPKTKDTEKFFCADCPNNKK